MVRYCESDLHHFSEADEFLLLFSHSIKAGQDQVYIEAGYGGMVAFDAATGHKRWEYISNADYATGSSPALANGYAYISLIDGRVYALDAMGGNVHWISEPIGAFAGSSPLVANGVLYIGSAGVKDAHVGSVFALDATTGRTLWSSHATGDTMTTTPTVANGMVYIVSGDSSLTKNVNGKLYAFHVPQ